MDQMGCKQPQLLRRKVEISGDYTAERGQGPHAAGECLQIFECEGACGVNRGAQLSFGLIAGLEAVSNIPGVRRCDGFADRFNCFAWRRAVRMVLEQGANAVMGRD